MGFPAAQPALALLAVLAAALADPPPTAAAVGDLYQARCQQCHQADGGSPLEPLNFADGKWLHGSKPEEVARVIADGVPGSAMLPFKDQLTPAQIEELADYVRSFDKTLNASGRRK